MESISTTGSGEKGFWEYVFQLRQQAVLCDIQLCVKDDEGNFIAFPAHKIVLVSSSEYFQACLSRDELLDVYNFDGISPHNLQVVLDFMYRQLSWSDLISNAEAAVAAEILKVIQHDRIPERPSNIIEDSEGKKIMFVKVFDKDPSRRQSGVARSLQKLSKPGKPASRYVIHSQAELQHHWKEARKKRQSDKGTPDEDVDNEDTVPEAEVAQDVPEETPPMEVQEPITAPDVSQLSLLADASMVQNREAISTGEEVMGIIVPSDAKPQDQTVESEEPPKLTEDTRAEETLEPGEISYNVDNSEEGEVMYKAAEAEVTTITSAVTKMRTRRSGRVGAEATVQKHTPPMTTRSNRGVQTHKVAAGGDATQSTPAPKPPPAVTTTPRTVTRSVPTPINVDTPNVYSSPYGTRKKKINLPAALVKSSSKRIKIEEPEQEFESADDSTAGGQLHSLLVNNTPVGKGSQEELIAGDVEGATVSSETHVEFIVKGEPEEQQEEGQFTEEEDDGDEDYALKRGPTKRIGRLRTRAKRELKGRPASQFECTKCNKTFKNLTGLLNHNNWIHGNTKNERESHAGSGEHTCNVCNKVVRSYAALTTHQLKMHNIQLRLTCAMCGEIFMQRRLLKAHQHKEHGVHAYKCDTCGATFKSREGWKIHLYKQHSSDEPSEMCQICGKLFKMKHELRNHLNITHSNTREHKCHLCDRAFKLSSTLKRHIQTYHSNMRNFECDVCHSKFKTKSDLLKHRSLHFREDKPLPATEARNTGEPESNKCRFCGKIFEKRYRLKAHEKIVHLEKQEGINYICTICNKSFAVKHYLMAHIAQKHRPRRYKCSRCQYEFSQPYMLRKHIAKCKGYPISAKPFKCPQCGRSFNLKGNLTKHLQLGRCERTKNEIVDYVVVVQQDENDPVEGVMDTVIEETSTAAHELEIEASQALQEMHGAAQIQGMQELQVQTTGDDDCQIEGSDEVHTEEIILEATDGQHTTMTTSEDGTVILHMMDPSEIGDGHIIHESTGEEVQTTVLEIHDEEQLGHVLQTPGTQIVQIDQGMEHIQQEYQIDEDNQNIVVQIIQAEEETVTEQE